MKKIGEMVFLLHFWRMRFPVIGWIPLKFSLYYIFPQGIKNHDKGKNEGNKIT